MADGCRVDDAGDPHENVRGDTARVELYFWAQGELQLSDERVAELHADAVADPPDEWETAWEARIRDAQGNANPYIEYYSR